MKQESQQMNIHIDSVVKRNLVHIFKNKSKTYRAAIMGEKQAIGMEDIISKNSYRSSSVICYSSSAEFYFMPTKTFQSFINIYDLHNAVKKALTLDM